MNTQTARNLLYTVFALILMFVQSGCAETVQTAPTATTIVDTSTPAATSTPADTPTLQATATFTETPTPTPTITPDVTATLLPEITPAVDGKGNVAGLVLWNDQPVAQAAVWLCERFEGGCVGRYQYKANTDQNGYYLFKNVTPGNYVVAINSFSTSWFIFYFDSSGNREQTVSEGKDLILDPWSIWKLDLQPISPKYNQVLSDPRPVFTWERYPDAAYYQIFIYQYNSYDLNSSSKVMADVRVDGNEFTPGEDFTSCEYFWQVEAFNTQGVKIAQIRPQNQYGGLMEFSNVDLPAKC